MRIFKGLPWFWLHATQLSARRSTNNMEKASNDYDFIIIGGGTSGLVVASRLAEDAQTKVLVLEAGENRLNDPNVNVPASWPSLIGSDEDWNYTTTPQVSLPFIGRD